MVNTFLKWTEVRALSTTATIKTIDTLRVNFASHGLPEELVSDNGPQFTAQEFADFTSCYSVRHTYAPPYHSTSNGAAEQLVKAATKVFVKQVLDDKLIDERRTQH